MYRNLKISVYFPCRNEADHLQKILTSVPNFVDEVIIVSNKSQDNTYKKALELGVKAFEDNRTKGGIGYGYAHMTGLQGVSGDIIATADGDGTYPIEKLDAVIDFLIDKNLDFVSCNRYPLQTGTNIPLKLQLGVMVLNLEVLLLYRLKIKDILSGMWVLTRETRDKLRLAEGDWNMSPEIKLKAALNPNIKFSEYGITQHKRLGSTKQHYWKTGLNHLWWIFKHRFTRRTE